jgi:hypothetical protein
VTLSAVLSTPCAVTLGSGLAGLPPSLPLSADVSALRFDVLLPRNAASFLVSFTPRNYANQLPHGEPNFKVAHYPLVRRVTNS